MGTHRATWFRSAAAMIAWFMAVVAAGDPGAARLVPAGGDAVAPSDKAGENAAQANPIDLPPRDDALWLLLDKVDGGRRYALLDRSTVDGLSVRVRWSTIHPRRGAYDFSLLDALADQARQRGKLWTLRVMAGTSSPAWLDCPRHAEGGDAIPLPWCPELKTELDALMHALGQRYSADPLLVMVHVPGFHRSAEMHMPKKRQWPVEAMTAAWQARIVATAASFPRQWICLNHSPEAWSPAVRQVHQALGPTRACFQMNALKASTSTEWSGYTVLADLSQAGWPVGFQFVGPSTNRQRFGGSFRQAVDKGQQAGARWYEFYAPDIDQVE